jgi:hypothetical protein
MRADDDFFDLIKRPGPPMRRADIERSLLRGFDDPPMPIRRTAEAWLHVGDDGSERWFTSAPDDMPSLHVWLVECGTGTARARIEETRTFLVHTAEGRTVVVRPRGAGWGKLAIVENGSAVWRRPVTKGNAPWG